MSASTSNAPRSVHVHVLYTVPPSTTTTFARSRLPTRIKIHPQMRGAADRWASCSLGEVVRTVVASSPSLLPTPHTDYSLHLTNPKQTYRESMYNPKSSTSPAKPVEVQSGLLGWALDDASKECESLVMGILRRDEIEGEEDDQDESDVEEWLEIRLRLVVTKPVSHAQHLSHLSFLQRGLPLPAQSISTPASSSSTSPTLTRSSLNSPVLNSGPSHSRKIISQSAATPSSSSSSTSSFKQPLLPSNTSIHSSPRRIPSSTPLSGSTFDPFQAPPSSRTTKRAHSPGLKLPVQTTHSAKSISSQKSKHQELFRTDNTPEHLAETIPLEPVKRGRGRPPGATNKSKSAASTSKRHPESSTSGLSDGPSSSMATIISGKSNRRSQSISSASMSTRTNAQPTKISSALSLPQPNASCQSSHQISPKRHHDPNRSSSSNSVHTTTKLTSISNLMTSPPDLLQAATENFTAFTPQLVDLLNLINKDAKVTDDKETAGILKSLLNAARAAEANKTDGGEIEDADSPLAGLGEAGSTKLGRTISGTARRKEAILTSFGGGIHRVNSSSGGATVAGVKRKSTGDRPSSMEDALQAGPVRGRKPSGGMSSGKRPEKEGCENCGSLTSAGWRKKEGCGKVCDACGVYYNRHKVKRPKELWGDLSAHMESSPENPLGVRPSSRPSTTYMHNTSPIRGNMSFQSRFSHGNHVDPSTQRSSNTRFSPSSPYHNPTTGRDMKTLPLTSPVRPVKRSMNQQAYESPRTALKKMLSGGGGSELRRLNKPLSDDGKEADTPSAAAPTPTPNPDITITADNYLELGLGPSFLGTSAAGTERLTDRELDEADGLSAMLSSAVQSDIAMTDAEWLHSDFSSFFEFGDEEPEERDQLHSPTPKKARLSTPRRNGIHEPRSSHPIASSSPMPPPFDFSSLPPSSPPVIPAGLFSSPDPGRRHHHPDLDLHESLFAILDESGPASTPASATSYDTEHSLADVEALQSLFAESPSSCEEEEANINKEGGSSLAKPQSIWGPSPTGEINRASNGKFDSNPLLSISEILSDSGTSPATSTTSSYPSETKPGGYASINPDPPSTEQQLEFLALWEQCQRTTKPDTAQSTMMAPPTKALNANGWDSLSRRGSMALVAGSSPDNDNGTPPTWVADEN
ncbi:Zinc finger, NHR/GATA-type [Phaffia rhodozyma]|uniref:Zinc finger, NHR/GATA-type n=1 Tax=Phaffia rhodozyma TaxID=264483 RepID=A0A0F7SWU4_PHARH|nr:Zinc finger, NHR/GATA-type [Phaffia rhodozyma]